MLDGLAGPAVNHNKAPPPTAPVGPDEEERHAQLLELAERLGEGRPAAVYHGRVVLVVEVDGDVLALEVLERDRLALLLVLGVGVVRRDAGHAGVRSESKAQDAHNNSSPNPHTPTPTHDAPRS